MPTQPFPIHHPRPGGRRRHRRALPGGGFLAGLASIGILPGGLLIGIPASLAAVVGPASAASIAHFATCPAPTRASSAGHADGAGRAGNEVPTAGILLPESAAARAQAGSGPETVPAAFSEDFRALGDDPWRDAATWHLWGALIDGERTAERPDPGRRAQLALLARRQGREWDAWRHYATLTSSPEWAAAALPFLIPGIPADAAVEVGGLPAPLPNGVILRPLPPPAFDPQRPLDPRTAEVHGLRIGDGRIRMLVKFESSGLEIELEHTGGEAVELAVVLPEPEGLTIGVEYTDWEREEDTGQPRALRLEPGAEAVSLYGRFQYKDARLPSGPIDAVPETLQRGGLHLVRAAAEPSESAGSYPLEAAAEVLAGLLGIEVDVRSPGDGGSAQGSANSQADGRGGVDVRLDPDPGTHLAYLAGRVETLLLRQLPEERTSR